MMNISDFHNCANCGACYNICPVAAISIEDSGLFYKPMVDAAKCIDCGVCVVKCPLNNNFDSNKPLVAYGMWSKDAAVVLSSSSGGVFWGIAQSVIKNEGIVYGAAFSDDFSRVETKCTEDVPIYKLQKSKYVESLVGHSFADIHNHLVKGISVLFCGTPCQVAGLKAFLGKDYENLITVDFACGGLPSHKIYNEYLRILSNKYHSNIKSVDFRPKTFGWKRYTIQVKFDNNREYMRLGIEDLYLRSFLYGKLTVRDYCLECKFAQQHYSDITLADFWLHNKMSKINNLDGISLVVSNTNRGNETLENILDDYNYEILNLSKATYNYKEAEVDESFLDKRAVFLNAYMRKGLKFAYKSVFTKKFKDFKYIFVRFFLKKKCGK